MKLHVEWNVELSNKTERLVVIVCNVTRFNDKYDDDERLLSDVRHTRIASQSDNESQPYTHVMDASLEAGLRRKRPKATERNVQ